MRLPVFWVIFLASSSMTDAQARSLLEAKLKDMLTRKEQGTLEANLLRNPAYRNQPPLFADDLALRQVSTEIIIFSKKINIADDFAALLLRCSAALRYYRTTS